MILRILASKDVYMVEANIPRSRQRQDIPRNRQDKILQKINKKSRFEVEFTI